MQQRIVEIVDRGDGTGEIWNTAINFETNDDELAATARFYSLFGKQDKTSLVVAGWSGDPGDRNVVLPFAIPQRMREVLSQLPQRDVTSLEFG